MSGYWYVATPYSNYPNGHEAAYKDACRAGAILMRSGWRILCPVAHSHSLCEINGTEEGIPDHLDPDLWKHADEPLLDAAYGLIVVMMPGWEESSGVQHEIQEARRQGKPVLFFHWPHMYEVRNVQV